QLGAGKTTLARGFLHALGHCGPVRSPTYTLVESYDVGPQRVYHFDLYRLGEPEELEYLGIRDYFDGVALSLVEWPGQGIGFLPEADLVLNIDYQDDGRDVHLHPKTEVGQAILAHFEQEIDQKKT
ncbi:MAG: tRNA (adenosine(37)-N6)-threonylcarbamoyltransferase complex ATPase subunit type 1 TsaE, partial [Gammaproteobacteria bacterium]|nr:tRNA (adenosine(37)-N6)-threonylcarbamoyltransferase complex ATPase subunit type 1 TsaE [Gammaproteobacteria bacterium]